MNISPDKLIELEKKFGGLTSYARKSKPGQSNRKTAVGGDRMSHEEGCHGYSEYYSRFLNFFNFQERLVLCEVGILAGTGLGIWSNIIKNGRIVGLDLDLSTIEQNKSSLQKSGMDFSNVEIYEFNQFEDNIGLMKSILKGDNIDIAIDDGNHSIKSILKTIDNLSPFLSKKFVYFIEDVWANKLHLIKVIKNNYPSCNVESDRELIVCYEP